MSAIPVPQPQLNPRAASCARACTDPTGHLPPQRGHVVRPPDLHRSGQPCRSCIHKKYWEFTGKNLLLGPWGTISLIVTPIYLIQNTAVYASALYKLRDAIE